MVAANITIKYVLKHKVFYFTVYKRNQCGEIPLMETGGTGGSAFAML